MKKEWIKIDKDDLNIGLISSSYKLRKVFYSKNINDEPDFDLDITENFSDEIQKTCFLGYVHKAFSK